MRLALWGCFIFTCLIDAVMTLSISDTLSGTPSARVRDAGQMARRELNQGKPPTVAGKITDKIASLAADEEYFSLELVPPKDGASRAKLRTRIERAKQDRRMLFVSITWKIGGTTLEQSLELAKLCQRELGVTTLLHISCADMTSQMLDKLLEDAKALGIRNIFAIRGGQSPNATDHKAQEFPWAADLVRYIRQKHDDYFCIGVATYPEGHFNASGNPSQSLEHDLPFLVDKVEAGADFIVSQLFFNASVYENFERRVREQSRRLKSIPIIPGILPIQSMKTMNFGVNLAHASVPGGIRDRLNATAGDREKTQEVAVSISSELVEQVRRTQKERPGPRGYHFFNANQEKAVSLILQKTGLVPAAQAKAEAATCGVPAMQLQADGATDGSGSSCRSQ